ncbi:MULTISPECIES: GapR family DNA-binding domain-containing protein [unclassified Candidatus Tisiphia]|jgi:uncharacterized protein (UPF0335 family)|uniref:GapR family DNA-binding domain-containing protein n=1 Tax=unclassified Candidatus Tisiphia TaxID=2996318 RepID=UPI001E746F37|nr:MAG: DUF2312 domain-containing protein [Rickettsia endosymbiont of Cimex lectularius]
MTEVIAKEQLEQYINQIEGLEQEKAELSEAIKDIFDAASSSGFDTKAMKSVLKLKKLDKNKLAEQDAILELYRQALGI